jgi:hypothetical protein
MTTARGRSISVPCSRNTSMGSKPSVAVPAVISFGRTRPMLASRRFRETSAFGQQSSRLGHEDQTVSFQSGHRAIFDAPAPTNGIFANCGCLAQPRRGSGVGGIVSVIDMVGLASPNPGQADDDQQQQRQHLSPPP